MCSDVARLSVDGAIGEFGAKPRACGSIGGGMSCDGCKHMVRHDMKVVG